MLRRDPQGRDSQAVILRLRSSGRDPQAVILRAVILRAVIHRAIVSLDISTTDDIGMTVRCGGSSSVTTATASASTS